MNRIPIIKIIISFYAEDIKDLMLLQEINSLFMETIFYHLEIGKYFNPLTRKTITTLKTAPDSFYHLLKETLKQHNHKWEIYYPFKIEAAYHLCKHFHTTDIEGVVEGLQLLGFSKSDICYIAAWHGNNRECRRQSRQT